MLAGQCCCNNPWKYNLMLFQARDGCPLSGAIPVGGKWLFWWGTLCDTHLGNCDIESCCFL